MEFEKILEMQAAEEAELAKEIVKKEPITLKAFDTRAVLADLKVLETKCASLITEATALEIDTAEEKLEAANISGDLQELAKQVKKKCEDFLEPHKKITSAINGAKKRIIEAATNAKKIVNQKLFQYKKQEEINQAKQQQIINEQAAKLQEKLVAQAKELKIEAPKVAAIKAPKPVKVIRGDTGASVYARSTWKCEITDPEKIERKYCLPSQKLLNQAVKMGKRKIEGCRIFKDETPVTRTG